MSTIRPTRFILTEDAVEDLSRIDEHLASSNPAAADSYADKFQQAFELLVRMPNAGSQDAKLKRRRARIWTVKPYLILYRQQGHDLAIVRVFHGAMDYRRMLK